MLTITERGTSTQETRHPGAEVTLHLLTITRLPSSASDYCDRAQTSATMAPPRHMPVPTRCTISTARMVARLGRASMLNRLRRPKVASTKTTRRDSRRELMDSHLLSVVDEQAV